MKKLIVLLLSGVLMLSSIGYSFGNEALPQEAIVEEGVLGYRLNVLKEFQEEIHQVNELRATHLQLRIAVVEAHDEILDLYIEAQDNEEVEKLQAAQEVRGEIRLINEEIYNLRQELKNAKESFRGAIKNKDLEAAKVYIDQVISLKTSIISKVEAKTILLQDIISILS